MWEIVVLLLDVEGEGEGSEDATEVDVLVTRNLQKNNNSPLYICLLFLLTLRH